MAYVKLPKELGVFATRQAGGRIEHFEFSMFAGETAAVERAPGSQRTALMLRSPKADKRFELRGLPDDLLAPGEAAAVIAVLPRKGDHGPIVAVANLDADERVDFRWREAELLKLLSGDARDERRRAAGRRGHLLAAAKGLGLGAAAYAAWALYHDAQALETPEKLLAALGAAWSVEAMAAALGVGAAAGAGFGLRSARRRGEKARRQQQALDVLWARVGHAFAYAADRSDAFRPLEGVLPVSRPRLAGPQMKPSRLLPPPETARRRGDDAPQAPSARAPQAALARRAADARRQTQEHHEERLRHEARRPHAACERDERQDQQRRREPQAAYDRQERRAAQEPPLRRVQEPRGAREAFDYRDARDPREASAPVEAEAAPRADGRRRLLEAASRARAAGADREAPARRAASPGREEPARRAPGPAREGPAQAGPAREEPAREEAWDRVAAPRRARGAEAAHDESADGRSDARAALRERGAARPERYAAPRRRPAARPPAQEPVERPLPPREAAEIGAARRRAPRRESLVSGDAPPRREPAPRPRRDGPSFFDPGFAGPGSGGEDDAPRPPRYSGRRPV